MGRKTKRIRIALFDRREVLRLGGGSLLGAALLPGCDFLQLPSIELANSIPELSSNTDFYVQSIGPTPEIDPGSHELALLNLGVEVARLDQALLLPLEAREIEHSLQCIGANPGLLFIDNARWEGLPFREVLGLLGVTPDPTAMEIKFSCADGYETSIPVTDLDSDPNAPDSRGLWLVWRMNGEPLPLDHGAPFRFITPGRYGTKNPKWPTALDFIDEPFIGTWERLGWSNQATYRTNGFVLSPPDMAEVAQGTVRLLGTAFSGAVPITAVEISQDQGDTWEAASIDYSPGAHIWTLWRYDWLPPGPGIYSFRVRVDAADGTASGPDPNGTNRLEGYDGGMEIEVEVV